MARILVADDEPSFRELMADILERAGHQVVTVRDGAEALAALEQSAFDLVLTDQRMPRVSGLEVVRRAATLPDRPPVVVLTAFGTIPEAVEAVRLGAADYLTKPLPSPAALLAVVERLLASPDSGEATFVTKDPALLQTLALVDTVAPRDVTVLITGESGTGKELIARRLHEKGGRSGRPFVAVNCAALPESLAESELFGHEKGAYTGADRSRPGRFEEAGHGTLFLDEVGELPAALQAKLLRALDARTVRRVGGTNEIPVAARVVAATNRDLAADVSRGVFRQDLYFRLAVVTIHLPPLRQRRGDIPLLARHLVATLAARHRIAQPELTPAAVAALERYSWPGNVRELRNVLERAVVVRGGQPIRSEDLALPTEGETTGGSEGAVVLNREARERAVLLEALRRAGGNREEAARLLGVSVRTLYYRLRRFGVT